MDMLFRLSYLPYNSDDEFYKKCDKFLDYVLLYTFYMFIVNVCLVCLE